MGIMGQGQRAERHGRYRFNFDSILSRHVRSLFPHLKLETWKIYDQLMLYFLRLMKPGLGHLATERPFIYYIHLLIFFVVRSERLELSWARPTRPSTVPVYQFQHDRMLCGRLNE